MHDAHGPEIIDEGRVGAEAPVVVADHFPGSLAVQEIVGGQPAARQHLPGNGPEFLESAGDRLAGSEVLMHLLDQRVGRVVARPAGWLGAAGQVVVEVMRFEMHDVVGQRVLGVAVVFAPAAEEDDGKAVFRKGPDDLVDPARDAAADVGKRSFQQQGDVGAVGGGECHARVQ